MLLCQENRINEKRILLPSNPRQMLKMQMNLFQSKRYASLEDAVSNAESAKRLSIMFPEYDLGKHGQDFLKLQRLKSLYIQGTVNLNAHNFSLPEEIGELAKLQKLTLLNVPLATFPDWIGKLTNLTYLMVRSNDVTEIPPFIKNLKKLHTLRVENCELKSIPEELKQLSNLRIVSLVDTKIVNYPFTLLPPKINSLTLSGPIYTYKAKELNRLRKRLPARSMIR